MLDKLIAHCCKLLEWCMTLFTALMVIMVFSNQVLRYAFNFGIAISDGFFALALCMDEVDGCL